MTDNRSSSALFKRAEQLKRWEESDTNKQSPTPRRASRIQFSSGIVFLAACTAGDKDEVQRLLKRGADINTANVDGLTALHQACIDDNLDMVEFLVTHGADVNRGDNEGWTPLHATASCGFVSIARYLLENGADVAAVNYDGELPVDIAESDAMGDMLQKIIDEKGVDCEKSRNAEVDTLLSDARNWAANGYVEVRDMNGGTPLHVAAAKGYIDVAKTLLEECSADPDCVDYEGWTPLHAAALWGQKEAAALLLKFGADPHIKNYSGQTCLDLVDPGMSSWLTEAMNAQRRMNNNNNKRKRSPPQHDSKRVDIEITPQQPEKVVNGKTDKPPASPEIIKTEGKPPRGRPPSPDTTETESSPEDAPSWRRSASFRNRQPDPPRDNNKAANNAVDNDTILRRTHSFENDKRINPTDRREREVNTWSGATTTTPSASPTNTTTTTTVRRSFVPPVRDEESETQRKAHAKRVRETRRSTQGVTLDEIKSAEQLVKKKAGNGTTESPPPVTIKKEEPSPVASPAPDNGSARASVPGGDVAVSLALACASATATATIAANSERRPSWRLRLDPTNKFELEDAGRSSPRSTAAAEATVTLPFRRPPTGSTANTTANTTTVIKDENRTSTDTAGEEEKERESSTESKSSSNASPASTQAALNVIQRRRRPKRRSTGVGHVDMDDIVNDRGGGGEGCEADNEAPASGSERTEEGEEKDYKALYEASQSEVRRLRALLATSEQQLREARATITRLTQVNQNSLSEIEKREKRAMERKLSEMEEELKQLQKLKAENERLRAENRALTRVVSKLTNSAAK
ncbi:protein phosphatase 1 regulatory subunit 12A isoform X8 [Helicoverpa armigera]|uniref:protein phosphatase 1 regulatory subunit 12A isoform X9 n=1 Tax=Helicoverpa zea TaxID=7113 RepID=UPI001F560DD0|nr:protein phosphatase 1 regulatory subunit 12A isoform X9 [Helicoverpa zea]XP_049695364.1 protein phosphatase 1 regulatory subunit 12A isoform X9 [Helicoverpa armigera]